MNYSRFLTKLSKNRKPSTIREMTNLLATASPDMVFLASGMPNPNLFPFEEATVKLRDGSQIKLDNKLMLSALQYGPTQGYPPLVHQLKSLVKRLHSPPLWGSTDLLVTPGSQDGLCKAIEMMVTPDSYFITQEPCYTGTLSILSPYTPKLIPVECDADGMIPDALRHSLSAWKPEEMRKQEEGVPKVLYVNPTGCNPSGATLTGERRREIYSLACEYDLVILEDDPYYFVQFEEEGCFGGEALRWLSLGEKKMTSTVWLTSF